MYPTLLLQNEPHVDEVDDVHIDEWLSTDQDDSMCGIFRSIFSEKIYEVIGNRTDIDFDDVHIA